MIMLPLHSQNTVRSPSTLNDSGQAILQKLMRKHLFVKQADIKSLPNSSKEIHTQNQHNTTNKIC
jgi:hypothetical protein